MPRPVACPCHWSEISLGSTVGDYLLKVLQAIDP